MCQPFNDPCTTCDPNNPTTCYTCEMIHSFSVPPVSLPVLTHLCTTLSQVLVSPVTLAVNPLPLSTPIALTAIQASTLKLPKHMQYYYLDASSRICMVCQSGCARCDVDNTANNYTCTECNIGYFLLGDNCISACPYMNYFSNVANNSCDACDSAVSSA
jgi:hypothetical protein